MWLEPTIPEVPPCGSWLADTTGQQERAQGDGEDQEIIDSAIWANSRHVNFLNLEAYFIF